MMTMKKMFENIRYIDSDEEYEAVDDAFEEFLDGQEFDELIEEDE